MDKWGGLSAFFTLFSELLLLMQPLLLLEQCSRSHCNVAGPFWRILKKCKEPGEARFLAFFQNSPKRTCNGIANQGTPRGSPVAFLAPPKGPPWTPWAFVGAGATIFVSATYYTTTRKFELGKPSQGPPGCSWNP